MASFGGEGGETGPERGLYALGLRPAKLHGDAGHPAAAPSATRRGGDLQEARFELRNSSTSL